MKATHDGYIVKRSSAGLGLFATKEYTRGDHIIEYTGERISTDEANERGGQYLFTLNKDVVIDGKGRENTSRYINHACKPNAEAVYDEEEEKIDIMARKKILPGEEITYDYGKEFFNEYVKPKGCKCSACTTK
jgi:SET domain-containing protein